MKTFKKYITEVELLPDYSKKKYKAEPIGPQKDYVFNSNIGTSETVWHHPVHISTTPSGHKIWKHTESDTGSVTYTATDKNNVKHIEVSASEKRLGNGITKLSDLNLKSFEGNTIKAHDFYHHLITHHDVMLIGNMQSKGGRHVWKQLQAKSKEKGSNLSVHGWIKTQPHEIKDPRRGWILNPRREEGRPVPLVGQPTHIDGNRLSHLIWKDFRNYPNKLAKDPELQPNLTKASPAIQKVGQMNLVAAPRKIKGTAPAHSFRGKTTKSPKPQTGKTTK